MLFNKILKSFFSLAFLIGFSFSALAADYNLRMTMNSNDQDEDYDGSIVFKNAQIKLFIKTTCLQMLPLLIMTPMELTILVSGQHNMTGKYGKFCSCKTKKLSTRKLF